VIVVATTPELYRVAKHLLFKHAHVKPTSEMQAVLWIDPETDDIEWVVAYDGFVGKCCQMHVVNVAGKSAPRKMLWACFHYPFEQAGLKAVMGIVDSNNEKAMRFDKHLGFKELVRLDGMHMDGGDLVLMKMEKHECRWLKLGARYEKQLVEA